MQAPRGVPRQRRADDAAGIANDEGHLLRSRMDRGEHEIALVLAVVVVGDGNDLALGKGLDGRFNACVTIEH